MDPPRMGWYLAKWACPSGLVKYVAGELKEQGLKLGVSHVWSRQLAG